jgi:hypothetical protein
MQSSILWRIWLNFMALLDFFALLQMSYFFRISNFFGLSITEETLLVEMRIWCIKTTSWDCLIFFFLALLQMSYFYWISNFFGPNSTEETLLVEMCIWYIKIGIVLVLHTWTVMYFSIFKSSSYSVTTFPLVILLCTLKTSNKEYSFIQIYQSIL